MVVSPTLTCTALLRVISGRITTWAIVFDASAAPEKLKLKEGLAGVHCPRAFFAFRPEASSMKEFVDTTAWDSELVQDRVTVQAVWLADRLFASQTSLVT